MGSSTIHCAFCSSLRVYTFKTFCVRSGSPDLTIAPLYMFLCNIVNSLLLFMWHGARWLVAIRHRVVDVINHVIKLV